MQEFTRFLSQFYNLKDIADYEVGPGVAVPLDRAGDAIDSAERFVAQIASLLDS